jgi:hypothetical protein
MKVTAVIAVVLCALAAFAAPAQAQNLTDTNILNFALNLEYLEASFYHCAVTGDPLPPNITGNGPTPTGCKMANLTGNTLVIARELLKDEQAHVTFLREALGNDSVPIPQIDIGTAFANAANAAFNTTLSPAFDPYANDIFFIHGAFIFEDVGVTAYQGAAALITNKDYLTPAAGILAVEAYHAGIIRSELYKIANTTTPYGVTVQTIVDNIAALRAAASMAMDDQGVILNGTANIVDANTTNSITFPRTPTQVLNIVTLGNGTVGGFFPDGVMLSA